MARRLHTEEEIRAAGAAAVKTWRLSDAQVDTLAILLSPLRSPANERQATGRAA